MERLRLTKPVSRASSSLTCSRNSLTWLSNSSNSSGLSGVFFCATVISNGSFRQDLVYVFLDLARLASFCLPFPPFVLKLMSIGHNQSVPAEGLDYSSIRNLYFCLTFPVV